MKTETEKQRDWIAARTAGPQGLVGTTLYNARALLAEVPPP